MAWSYSGDPKASDLDKVRFTIGDTDEQAPLLSDEEIQYLLEIVGDDTLKASIKAVNRIIAKLAREVDYSIGPESVKVSQRLKNYRALLRELKNDLSSLFSGPVWTGSTEEDPLRPIFDVGMHDNKYNGIPKVDG